jgi:protein-S-isoprenylcysteine O-methyltransferase Ste14
LEPANYCKASALINTIQPARFFPADLCHQSRTLPQRLALAPRCCIHRPALAGAIRGHPMTLLAAKIVWGLGCVAYFIIRYPYQRRARKTPVKRRPERKRERLLIAISFSGLFLVPLLYVVTNEPVFATYAFHPLQAWLGTTVLIATMVLLRVTHRDLGRAWSVTLEVREQHALVTQGIYQRLRHPMYSSFWLWAISQALLLPNWIAGLAGIVGFGTLFFARVGHEERMMLETFGNDYRAYMARTHRIIPGIY